MRHIKPKYCPRTKSKDMPLKRANLRCPFRTPRDGRFLCICPSAIRYMTDVLKLKNLFNVNLLCIAEPPKYKTRRTKELDWSYVEPQG